VSRIQPNIRRVLLGLLSLLSVVFIAQSLFTTVDQPQAPTLLDLLQTDIALQASAWKTDDPNLAGLQEVLLEKDPTNAYKQALESYQSARKSNLSESKAQFLLKESESDRFAAEDDQFLPDGNLDLTSDLNPGITKNRLLNELDLRIGILQALINSDADAQKSWNQVVKRTPDGDLAATAKILIGIWRVPTEILPNSESLIKANLDRWSESAALEKLFLLQKRSPELKLVSDQRQIAALNAIGKLAIASAVPIVGGLVGCILWLVLLTQRLFWSEAALLRFGDRSQIVNSISWEAEKTWEVMVLWFSSYVGISFLLPFFLLLISAETNKLEIKFSGEIYQAIFGIFLPYCITMAPMLPIIYWSLPKPQNWLNLNFKSLKWIAWGIGGYFAAVPLVLIASSLSEKIWQGQGGSNPLLPILTESTDNLAKLMLWVTLAIAAPFFEEYLFRGFLFSSLVKLVPIPFALLFSGFCFATVHLNLGDILPLTVLGVVLGFVYHKSRNLLAPILLHCLWNSGSFVSLLALGT
jgi:uncharacterized protein